MNRGKFKHILRIPCSEVTSDESINLICDLKDTLIATPNAAGLAAPQIGKSLRAFVVKNGNEITAFINPIITVRSDEKNIAEEGCLSVPGFRALISRSTRIMILHDHGKTEVKGFRARVIQHELDHLDGILITDREARHA